MTSKLGAGTGFRKRAVPSPKGEITINEETGEFKYTPAPEDRDDFVVWIQARNARRDEKQKVFITPHPRLLSEFNVIEHVSAMPPDHASRLRRRGRGQVPRREQRLRPLAEHQGGGGGQREVHRRGRLSGDSARRQEEEGGAATVVGTSRAPTEVQWIHTPEAFDVDQENRVIAFTRPAP